MNILIATTTKINAILLVFVLVAGTFTAISSLEPFSIVKVQAQKAEESEMKEDKMIERLKASSNYAFLFHYLFFFIYFLFIGGS